MRTKILKPINKRRTALVLALSMTIVSLTACGRSKQDEIGKSLVESQTNGASASDAQNESSVDLMQGDTIEHVSYSYYGERVDYKLTVDVDVKTQGYGSLAVYEQTIRKIDDEAIKDIATKLFDNGEYDVIKPYEISSKDELEVEKEYLESLAQEYNLEELKSEIVGEWEPYLIELIDSVEFYIENYDAGNVKEVPDGQLIMYVEGGSYTPIYDGGIEILAECGNKCMIRGTVNGEIWMLSYEEPGGEKEYLGPELKLFALTQNTIKYMNTFEIGYDDINEIKFGDNKCDYQEAEKQVESTLVDLGLGEFEVVFNTQIACYNDGLSQYLDGYGMVCAPAMGTIKYGYSNSINVCSKLGVAESVSDQS